MELNLNSLHARIFRSVLFVETHQMPKTLCPYFWQSVLMWVFMPLILLVTLPKRILLLFKGNKHNFWESVILSLGLYFGLFIVYSMGFFVYCLFTNPTKEFLDRYERFIIIGFLGWGVGIISSITYGFLSIKEKMDRKKFENYEFGKPKKKNVIVESVKGFYNKYCPRITWK